MDENVKEVWKEIYALTDNLAINRERLKYLVEGLIGKQRTETVEEANTLLSFLEAVDSKFKNRVLSLDEAIEEAKKEYKDSKGEETLGEPTDADVEKMGADVENELRDGKLASIASLLYQLNWSRNTLDEKVEKKYDKTLKKLSLEELDEVIASLDSKNVELEKKEELKDNVREKEKKVIEAEVVEAEVVEEEEQWAKTAEIDEGTFMFREDTIYVAGIPTDVLLCKSGASGNVYSVQIDVPKCSCNDFQIRQKQEWCKHLKACSVAGYPVKEIPKIPEELSKALPKQEKKKKAKKEETVAIEVLGKKVDLVVQIPQELIRSEEIAAEMIKSILGPNPKREDVIEEYNNIEEIAADVIVSLAQYSGIRFQPFSKEIEVVTMNLGKIFKVIPMTQDKMEIYGPLADFMPDTAVTVRCKITSIAGWRDSKGDLHFGMGTKEEHLTPYKLKDIVTRGSNFIETMCETKSAKKSILGCLPITHNGLLRKIKYIYGWR